jgi:hypothetical protein
LRGEDKANEAKIKMVLRARLELARLSALAPKTSAATDYATSAKSFINKIEFIE